MADEVKSCVWIVLECSDGKIRIQHDEYGHTSDPLPWKGPQLEVGVRIDLAFCGTVLLHEAVAMYEKACGVSPKPPTPGLFPIAGKPGMFFDKENSRIINMIGYSGEECKAALAACLPDCQPVARGDRVRSRTSGVIGIVQDLTEREAYVLWSNGISSWARADQIEPTPAAAPVPKFAIGDRV